MNKEWERERERERDSIYTHDFRGVVIIIICGNLESFSA
jgi:hypothetical protein